MTISLVIADDHPLVLDGLTRLFEVESDVEVVARCSDGEQAVQATLRHCPSVLVLDLSMPRKDGTAVIRELKQHGYKGGIVLLTSTLDEQKIMEAVRLGVRGVVLKEMAPQLLLQCVRRVDAGGQWLERDILGRALDTLLQREAALQDLHSALSQREITLVKLVADGRSNREIAEQLHITEGTVKVHLHRIYEKTGVKNRVGLTLYAQQKGLC